MQKKLTITLDEEVYNKLYNIIGRGNISHFIEMRRRRYFGKSDLEGVYRQMAQDEERKADALEWTEAVIGDIDYEERRDLVGQL